MLRWMHKIRCFYQRELGIVSYHSQVQQKCTVSNSSNGNIVKLIQTVRLPLQKISVVAVQLEKGEDFSQMVVEPSPKFRNDEDISFGESLVKITAEGRAFIPISNPSGSSLKLEEGTCVGHAVEATVVVADWKTEDSDRENTSNTDRPLIQAVSSTYDSVRERKLADMIAEVGPTLKWQERDSLRQLLPEKNPVFVVEEGEHGNTDLVQMTIDTRDATPIKQPLRRTPFAARQEVANQLRKMQSQGIIQPSTSSWASPVVLVRKNDGSLRFCIDYRALNSVTKTDQFPLPRIDDLLDQLGRAKYFTTLDLAAGYWQVEMHPDSKEKTAFATYQGLYEFNVMPFGLKNAPGVFQRLMQRVLMGLNPENGPDFVATYLDDVLIFSTTFEEHLVHLRSVLDRLLEVGLKLKPAKCHFICQSVEYLGHLVTPQGISPNPARVAAYPTPTSVKEMRQFVGIASYYRRFIKGFAKVAQPLHALTQKGAVFKWSVSCQEAFQHLKNLLVEAPVLSYPDFLKPFTLETDASVLGLGAVLSQQQDDGHLHPVAYASRALSPQEKRYGITELETLAVVWSMQHYHAYLYGHEVTVFTDHSAVKAVLETPSPSGEHARW